jgi:hypothetical protein
LYTCEFSIQNNTNDSKNTQINTKCLNPPTSVRRVIANLLGNYFYRCHGFQSRKKGLHSNYKVHSLTEGERERERKREREYTETRLDGRYVRHDNHNIPSHPYTVFSSGNQNGITSDPQTSQTSLAVISLGRRLKPELLLVTQ